MRQILSVSFPIVVFLSGCLYWKFIAWKRNLSTIFLFKRMTLTFLVVSFVSYISLVKAAVQIFHCVDVFDGLTIDDDGVHRYWEEDTLIHCFVDSHLILSLTFGIPLVLFSFLYPFFLAVFLIIARNFDHLESMDVQETVGLFYRGYEKEFVFWDSIIMLRKAALAAIIVFAYNLGGNLQAVLTSVVLLLSLFLQTKFDPFKRDLGRLNELECASLFINSLTFLFGIILNDPFMNSDTVKIIITAFVFLTNVSLFVLLVLNLFFVFIEKIKFNLLAEGVGSESMNSCGVIKMLFAFQAQRAMELMRTANQNQENDESPSGGEGEIKVATNIHGSEA